jgi:hypothetical protein
MPAEAVSPGTTWIAKRASSSKSKDEFEMNDGRTSTFEAPQKHNARVRGRQVEADQCGAGGRRRWNCRLDRTTDRKLSASPQAGQRQPAQHIRRWGRKPGQRM